MLRPPKLASLVAKRIETEILEKDLPVGHRFATEAELVERYRVSRPVLRQAIRLVERHQLGEMRRGGGGGLVVARPPRAAAARVLSEYLLSVGVSWPEAFEARSAVEPDAAWRAASRIDGPGAEALRKHVVALETAHGVDSHESCRRLRSFHTTIAEIAGEPAVTLIVHSLYQLGQLLMPVWPPPGHPILGRRREIAEAIIAGDAPAAYRLMESYLADACAELRPPLRTLEGGIAPDAEHFGKIAERLAGQIAEEIRERDLSVGERLGSEQDLIERHGVSRAVLRQSIRLLEQHSIVEMRRGKGGGLFVSKPDPSDVVASCALFFRHLGIRSINLREARVSLEPVGAALAAKRIDLAGRKALERLLGAALTCDDATLPEIGSQLHEGVADLSGNRAIALFVRVLMPRRDGSAVELPRGLPDGWESDVRGCQARLVAAICQGDSSLAHRAMQEFLEMARPWWHPDRLQ